MAHYDPWLSYAGASRIWLAVVLFAVAGGLVYAGIRLRLPVQPARAGRMTVIVTLAAWIIALAALLTAIVVYVRQYASHRSAGITAYPDHVAPVTFSAVVILFVIILIGSRFAIGPRLVGAVIGAIAAPFIFELPFDLIIMGRVHVPFTAGSDIAVLFALLLLVDITTLLLLRLSPMVALNRATFYCLALMLAVFAVWALTGFGYPSAPVPLTLNIVSKLLAFATALTLFFPAGRNGPASGQRMTSAPGDVPVPGQGL